MKKLFLFLTVAALLSGCDHSDEQSPIVETGRIDLRPGIEALTRSPHLAPARLPTEMCSHSLFQSMVLIPR